MNRKYRNLAFLILLIGAALGFILPNDHTACPKSNCNQIEGVWDPSLGTPRKLLVFPTQEGLAVIPAQ